MFWPEMGSRNFSSFLPSVLWFRQVTFLSLLVAVSGSCNVINPAEPVPAYIHVSSVSLSTNYPTEGSAATNITDAWVFVDNAYLGTFPLPASFPIIGEGSHKISVRAGIYVNGLSGNRVAYPKYSTYDTLLVLKSNQDFTINPVVQYNPGTVFVQLEDFDNSSLSLENTTSSTATMNLTSYMSPDAFENYSGYVHLDANHSFYEAASSDTFQLPVNVPVFAELNYRCENEFTVGLFVSTAGGVVQLPLVNVHPSSTWKKIFINLSDLGGVVSEGIAYKLYLSATKDASLNTADLYFDNLKVLY